MRNTMKRSIGTRILVSTLLVSFLSLSVTGVFMVLMTRRHLAGSVFERNLELARHTADEISRYAALAVGSPPDGEALPPELVTPAHGSALEKIIGQIPVGSSGGVVLLAGDGSVLASRGTLCAGATETKGLIPDPEAFTADAFAFCADPGSGGKMLSIISPVNGTGWTVRVDRPYDETFLPVGELVYTVVILFGLGLTFALIASIVITRGIAGPIWRLAAGTDIIGEGNLEYRFPVTSFRELRTLAESFNRMLEQLQEKNKALEDSERRYRHIAENSSDIVFTLDKSGFLTYINRKAEEISGYARSELVGRHISTLPFVTEFDMKRLDNEEEIGKLAGQEIEIVFVTKRGEHRTLETNIVRLPESGQQVLFLGVSHDVTEKAQIFRRLLQSEKLSSLGELVAGVAHELNNPMTSVLGYAELLRQEHGESPAVKTDLEKIIVEATRAKKILRNLLIFARRYPPEKAPTDLNDVIESVLEVRAYEISANRIEIERMLDPNLPPVVVDPHRMRQVFLNIVNNAINAMKEQQQERCLTVITTFDATSVRITFQDSGSGIPSRLLTKVFDPFFTTMEVGKGTGLGLSLSYSIVEEHGGKITTLTRRGEGTQFVIELPLDPSLVFSPAPERRTAEDCTIPPARVLVLEEEETLRTFIRRVLEKEGCRVDTVQTIREAVERLERESYDVVLSDFVPEGPQRQTLYRWLKEYRPSLLGHTIVMTGDTLNDDEQSFLTDTRIVPLAKPFTIDELKRVVRSAVPVASV